MISFDDFKKLEIKIGTITNAEEITNSDRLLKLTINFGDEERTIVAGIKQHYLIENLINKQVPVLTNLEPKQLCGIESQGMLLAIDFEDKPILMGPDQKVDNGSIIR